MDLRRIVVGFDGSENATRALDCAVELLSPDGTIHVVTASEPAERQRMVRVLEAVPDEFRTGLDLDSVAEAWLLEAAEHVRSAAAAHVPHRAVPPCVVPHLVDGDPAEAILDVAEEVGAELVVVGSRGLRRGTRFLRGSVSSRVANHARCSFLVVHDG